MQKLKVTPIKGKIIPLWSTPNEIYIVFDNGKRYILAEDETKVNQRGFDHDSVEVITTRESQNKKVLAHLQAKSITSVQAIQSYGITRLSARIYDLQGKGHVITTELIQIKNDPSHRYAKYTLSF